MGGKESVLSRISEEDTIISLSEETKFMSAL
jgi:hypothetical protein